MGPAATYGLQMGMGILEGAWNDQRQRRQNEQLGIQQMRFDKAMTDYSYQKQLEMWKKTGYVGQKEQMIKAGLNPAMMYGMGGGGGTTTGSGAEAVHAPTGPVGGGEIQAGKAMGLQLGLIEAQKKVLETQADKNQAEADKTRGVDTEAQVATIDNLKQGLDNARSQNDLLRIDLALKRLEQYKGNESIDDQIREIEYNARTAVEHFRSAAAEAKMNEATIQDRINLIKNEAIGAAIRNTLTTAQIGKTQAEINKIATEIQQKWIEITQKGISLTQEQQKINIEKFKAEIQATYPDIWKVGGKVLQDGIEALEKLWNRAGGNSNTWNQQITK